MTDKRADMSAFNQPANEPFYILTTSQKAAERKPAKPLTTVAAT